MLTWLHGPRLALALVHRGGLVVLVRALCGSGVGDVAEHILKRVSAWSKAYVALCQHVDSLDIAHDGAWMLVGGEEVGVGELRGASDRGSPGSSFSSCCAFFSRTRREPAPTNTGALLGSSAEMSIKY